jgi:hypothetical protein
LLEHFEIQADGVVVLHYDDMTSDVDVSSVLGADVEVCVLFLKQDELAFGNQAHDKNLVIKVTYCSQDSSIRRSILLPGDANGTLLSSLLSVEENRALLKDIDCMVLPHHGSNNSGEFAWLNVKDFVSDNRLFSPLLTIVSSDPDAGKSAAIDVLPWPEIQHFSYERVRYCSLDEDTYFCMEHIISARSREKVQIGIKSIWCYAQYGTSSPIFTTCDALQGFYKVAIWSDGTMTLHDGLETEPLYFSK